MRVHDFHSKFGKSINITAGFANFGNEIFAFDIAELLQFAPELLCLRAQRDSPGEQKAHPIHPRRLRIRSMLRARRKRPRHRGAKHRDELTAFHSITSSARASSVGGIVRPSLLDVLRLMTRLSLVGCSTDSSPGAAPFKILSMNAAERRKLQGIHTP